MAATGYTTGDPQKVDVTGDSMTGDLTLAGSGTDLSVGGNLTVTGSSSFTGPITGTFDVSGTLLANYQGVPSAEVVRLLATTLSTGFVSGGNMSPNSGDSTKLDITAAAGWIVDYDVTSPISSSNPSLTFVSMPAQSALTPTVGVPTGVTWWMVDEAGTITQQTTQPTPTQRRTHLVYGATAQVSNVIIVDQTLPTINTQPVHQLIDLMEALGPFIITGNRLTPDGANLTFNKAVGTAFVRAFSQIPMYNDPHTSTLAAQTPCQFRHITAVQGGAGALVTSLNVGFYDPSGAGVVTAIPGGANTATNFRVWGFASNTTTDQMLVQYGQNTYSTLSDARAAIGSTNYIVNPTAMSSGVLLGWISVIKSATNLSDPAQATFTSATGKFETP